MDFTDLPLLFGIFFYQKQKISSTGFIEPGRKQKRKNDEIKKRSKIMKSFASLSKKR